MTFTLLRAGLPNSVIAAALAVMPIVAIALSTPQAPVRTSVADLSAERAQLAVSVR